MSALPVADTQRPEPRIVSAFTLLKNFKPIETVVDGLPMPRGGLVSITAPTGHAKTTTTTLLHSALTRGIPFAGRDVTRGSVLVLAGENPDDYAMHLAATVQDQGIYTADLSRPSFELLVIPGTFNIDYELEWLKAEIKYPLVAVFVDTSAAFFPGDDENDNVSMRRHASSLRGLTELEGRPTVFVLCHPTKSAQRDNLLPRGGGSFLAEVDANLTLWKDEAGIVTLHWAGKIRGSSFDPIQFELVPVELEGYKDCRGRPITSVAARHVPPDRAEQLHDKATNDEDRLLVAMQKRPGATVRDLAMECGFVTAAMKPHTSRLDRTAKALRTHGLVDQDRKGKWFLTPKGQKEADRL